MPVILRKHQAELNQTIDGIIAGRDEFKAIRKIIISACPGAGKGSVPVNAGKLLFAGLADKIVCIVPRESLQTQAEAVCMDPFFQELFGVKIQLRSSTNERDPCRGLHGFVTTFQALGHDKNKSVLKFLKSHRCVLIGDEVHHQREGSPWHNAFNELVGAAEYAILMSGTLSRSDKERIGCLKYHNGYVDLRGDENTHVIQYSRAEAIQEKAILPLSFHLYDGEFSWKPIGKEEVKEVSSFSEVQISDRSSALYTALETEFSEQLMESSLVHWLKWKKDRPAAKILFVCARIEDARRCLVFLKGLGIKALLATSHASKECRENINRFKGPADVLVTIAVAYEGLDVPAISHVCILTRIRSAEWLEQCVSRATRVCKKSGSYHSQAAHIFAPRDPAFMEFVDVIEREQKTRISAPRSEQIELFPVDETVEGGGQQQGPCVPLRSQIRDMASRIVGTYQYEAPVQTPKARELDLRKQIDRHLKRYAIVQGYEFPLIMAEVKREFGKPRGDMTLPELEKCWARVQQMYPFEDRGQYIPPSRCRPVFDRLVEPEMRFF
jgi:superfamily II DNA or RNA helicase